MSYETITIYRIGQHPADSISIQLTSSGRIHIAQGENEITLLPEAREDFVAAIWNVATFEEPAP